uniref:Uncharacterized protein n=1 Tax=Solanum tuberosum TaxID=4113 RepID=M1A1S4_SOLTU
MPTRVTWTQVSPCAFRMGHKGPNILYLRVTPMASCETGVQVESSKYRAGNQVFGFRNAQGKCFILAVYTSRHEGF